MVYLGPKTHDLQFFISFFKLKKFYFLFFVFINSLQAHYAFNHFIHFAYLKMSMIAIFCYLIIHEILPYWNDCRSECGRWDSAAEREGRPHSDLRWHEGGVRSGLSLSHRQHAAPCWPPAALLPATETLGRCGQRLHGHLLSESGWVEARDLPNHLFDRFCVLIWLTML